jgi:hypothetical protein
VFHIRRASVTDFPDILAVLDEQAAWLRERGITQWPSQFSGLGDWRERRLLAHCRDGNTFLLLDNDCVAGTFTLAGPDPDFVHGWPGPDPERVAVYLYRMAIGRKYAGNDLGGRILNWSAGHAAARGYDWIRGDCHRGNTALRRYYEEHGCELVNTVVATIPDGGDGQPYTRASGALYQRPASSIGK